MADLIYMDLVSNMQTAVEHTVFTVVGVLMLVVVTCLLIGRL